MTDLIILNLLLYVHLVIKILDLNNSAAAPLFVEPPMNVILIRLFVIVKSLTTDFNWDKWSMPWFKCFFWFLTDVLWE